MKILMGSVNIRVLQGFLRKVQITVQNSAIYKWSMVLTAPCEGGAKEQTLEHAITTCSIYHYLNGARALSAVDKSSVPDRHIPSHLLDCPLHLPQTEKNKGSSFGLTQQNVMCFILLFENILAKRNNSSVALDVIPLPKKKTKKTIAIILLYIF